MKKKVFNYIIAEDGKFKAQVINVKCEIKIVDF